MGDLFHHSVFGLAPSAPASPVPRPTLSFRSRRTPVIPPPVSPFCRRMVRPEGLCTTGVSARPRRGSIFVQRPHPSPSASRRPRFRGRTIERPRARGSGVGHVGVRTPTCHVFRIPTCCVTICCLALDDLVSFCYPNHAKIQTPNRLSHPYHTA